MHLLTYLSTNSLRILYCVSNPGLQHPLHACGCAAGTHGTRVEPVTGTASFCPSYSKASTRQATVSMSEHFSLFSRMKSKVWRWSAQQSMLKVWRWSAQQITPKVQQKLSLAICTYVSQIGIGTAFLWPSETSPSFIFLKERSLDCLFIHLFLEILLHSAVRGWLAWNLQWSQSAPECWNRRHAAPCPASNLL